MYKQISSARKKLVIFGMDDMAEIVKFMFENDSDYEVAAFTVDHAYKTQDNFCGLPVCDFENVEMNYPPESYEMFLAIGYSHVNRVREAKFYEAKAKGYTLASYISSHATCFIPLESIGENTFIFEDNTIQPFVKIGSDVILWSGNHIGHHSKIGNHVFITSHVVLSGRTVVGDNSFIGVNATVNDHVHIAERCVIGSGALITKDTEPDSVYKNERTPKNIKKGSELQYFNGQEPKNIQ